MGRGKKDKWEPYDYESAYRYEAEGEDALARLEIQRLIDGQRKAVYATKTVRAGPIMDVEVYPEFTRLPAGMPKLPRSSAAQRNLNEINSRKACERKINANFTTRDLWITLSYAEALKPGTMAAAMKNVQNWIGRVNYRRKKQGLDLARYVYVTEWEKDGRKVRVHHHVVMDGDVPGEELLKIWGMGRRSQARRLEYDENGLTGISKYITKAAPMSGKRWCASKNLIEPKERKNHRTFRRRRVERMALRPGTVQEEMERAYPGYWLTQSKVRHNRVNGLFYVTAKMRCKARPGDMVQISSKADDLASASRWARARMMSQEYRVLDTDDTPGKETVTLLAGRERWTIPARAVIVIERKAGYT